MSNKDFHIWEGIYDRFPEEDADRAFESQQWINTVTERALEGLSEFKEGGGTISTHTLIHEYPLSPVVALLGAALDTRIRILDFGGGLGSGFLPLITSLPTPDLVEFHIVENPAICQRGREVYHGFHNLHFHDKLPRNIENFDVVHAGSSLHYVADWRMILGEFASYEPRLIVLSGLTAGDIETFVTYQNYYGSMIPAWFWNVREIIDAVGNLRYTLIYRSLLASSYLGKIQPPPMENFPPKYRLRRKCNLIFMPNNCSYK